jgi:hypothetical protein
VTTGAAATSAGVQRELRDRYPRAVTDATVIANPTTTAGAVDKTRSLDRTIITAATYADANDAPSS